MPQKFHREVCTKRNVPYKTLTRMLMVALLVLWTFHTTEYYRELRMYKVLLHTTTQINLINYLQLITKSEDSE